MPRGQNNNSPITDLNYGDFRCLPDLLESAAARFGQRVAFSNNGCDLSFRELEQQSCAFAAYLQQRTDLRPGDRLAIQLPNLLQYPIALFGALRAGLVVVNTNPRLSVAEMQQQFVDADVKALVVVSSLADKVEQLLPQTAIETLIITDSGDLMPSWKRWPVNCGWRYLSRRVQSYRLPQAVGFRAVIKQGRRLAFEQPALQRTDLALLQYTGGTTGQAKGAMLSHGNLLANLIQLRGMLHSITEEGREVLIAPLPLYHIFALNHCCLLMLDIGAQVVLITEPRDVPAFIRQMRRHRFTLFSGINPVFSALLDQPNFHRLDFNALKLTFSAGMALDQEVAQHWYQATAKPLMEGYGLTETSPVVTANPPHAIRMGSIGRPLPATEIKLVDEQGHSVPVGGCGELWVRGPQVMQGYWKRAQASAEVLDTEGWLHTGDIVRMDEQGYLTLIERKSDVIHVDGFNIYPNEIETVIKAHKQIDDCAVIGLPDHKHGERIKLYVVANDPALTVQQIRNYCRERLSPHRVPAQVEFRRELPQLNNGKALRKELRAAELRKGKNCGVGTLGASGRVAAPLP